MKKSVLVFTLVLVVLVVFTISPVSAEFAAYGLDLTMEIKIRQRRKASQASEKIIEFFSSCPQKDLYEPYPEYYAGGYIDDNNIYHACFADASNKHVDECRTILSEFGDSVVIEYRKYSFSEMHDYATKVAEGLKALGCVRYSWGVDIPGNAVNIEISKDSMSLAEKSLELVADNPDIKVNLKIGSPLIFESGTTLIGGDKLGIPGGFFITLAATGTYKGYNAFLTCGHGLNVNDKVYYSNTATPIGTVTVNRGNDPDGSFFGDYSIGKLESNFSPSHKARTGSSSTILWKGTMGNPEAGVLLRKYGSTSGFTYLKVYRLHEVTDLGCGKLQNMTLAIILSGSSTDGDSGGPYWTATDLKFCGVHAGKTKDGYAVFTPYYVIQPGGFRPFADHDGSWENYSSSKHKMSCSLCNGNIYESHSLGSWVNYNSTYHKALCSICESYVYRSHSGSWSDYNSTYHKTYCSTCKSTVYEPHSAYYNSALGKCTRCGRTGNITNSIDPELPSGSFPGAVNDTP